MSDVRDAVPNERLPRGEHSFIFRTHQRFQARLGPSLAGFDNICMRIDRCGKSSFSGRKWTDVYCLHALFPSSLCDTEMTKPTKRPRHSMKLVYLLIRPGVVDRYDSPRPSVRTDR